MTRFMFRMLALALLAVGPARADGIGADASLVPPAPLHETVLRLAGDPDRPVELEVTLFTPSGSGPFPLAVLNHGATAASAVDRGTRYRYTYSAYYFLSRGYAVALPMARGFADSGGEIVHDGCALDGIGLANARDLRAVVGELRRMPQIDPDRIVVGGQSFGGWTTLALGTLDVPGVRGLLAFSPALRVSDCPTPDPSMVDGARRFGGDTRLPSLWFYGDNDSIMPTLTWTDVFDAYREGSARATLVRVGRLRTDSHQMLSYSETLPLWTPHVDAFLARIGLPAAEIHPEYLPIPIPPPTGFAALADASAVPFLNDKGRAGYRQFLALPFPRVFAIAANGAGSVSHGGFDPLARALGNCRNVGLACRPYAVNDQVVWVPGALPSPSQAGPAPRVVPAGRPSRIVFVVSLDDDCGPKPLPLLRLVGAPAHGDIRLVPATGHPGFPPGSRLAACNAATVSGTAIMYTPGTGYAGPDSAVIGVASANGSSRTVTIPLLVRQDAVSQPPGAARTRL